MRLVRAPALATRYWYPKRGSNPHAFRRQRLKLLCLPIPPSGLGADPGTRTPNMLLTKQLLFQIELDRH